MSNFRMGSVTNLLWMNVECYLEYAYIIAMFINIYLVCGIMLENETSQLNHIFNALEICLTFQGVW